MEKDHQASFVLSASYKPKKKKFKISILKFRFVRKLFFKKYA